MQVNFERVGIRYRSLIKKIFDYALKFTNNYTQDAIITVSFANESTLKDLNRQYRNIDKATDVLSFPMLDIVYPQKLKDFLQELSPDGSLYIGDIVICPKIAKKQAKAFGHSQKREVAFLALHGLLHILGYDHIEKEDEQIMQNTAEEILENLNIKRKSNV